MKAVLISIRPEWCEKIARGKKTIEVRKNRPKLETPFKCYIYCTRGPGFLNWVNGVLEYILKDFLGGAGLCMRLNGKIIGEFVCDRILPICINCSIEEYLHNQPIAFPQTGLSDAEIVDYLGNGAMGYGWHISDLVIYDNPKELSEFTGIKNTRFGGMPYKIQRPPQSWCYVEVLE